MGMFDGMMDGFRLDYGEWINMSGGTILGNVHLQVDRFGYVYFDRPTKWVDYGVIANASPLIRGVEMPGINKEEFDRVLGGQDGK